MNRRAFTLVELLVALIMVGVGVAGLVSALTGDRRLRDMAAAHAFAADRARELTADAIQILTPLAQACASVLPSRSPSGVPAPGTTT